jgi:hypothetical protein
MDPDTLERRPLLLAPLVSAFAAAAGTASPIDPRELALPSMAWPTRLARSLPTRSHASSEQKLSGFRAGNRAAIFQTNCRE